MAQVPIVTSNWRTLNALHEAGSRDVVPVRISLGTPRWYPWAEGVPYIPELAPYGLLTKPPIPADEFERRYIERLEKMGVPRIERRFVSLHAEYLRPLALLCYEPAGKPCHRRLFAAWWLDQTGQEITEL